MRGCLPCLCLCLLSFGLVHAAGVDFADPKHRDAWLSHPVIGDVSYDSFVRSPANPIYTGRPPYEWPVNGFLFRDPPTGHWYCYISLYPKGYWPAGPTHALRSRDAGRTWEDLGIVLHGDPGSFDGDGTQAGATLDPSVVMDGDGYHMVYGWAKPDNSDGGLAYAHARSPAGPWRRHSTPLHAESAQPMVPLADSPADGGTLPQSSAPELEEERPVGYKRVYAGSLVRRANDWLVLASMSTPRNAGGTWANICMTAPRPEGPWSAPTFLRKPQGGRWLPQPIEFFPAFVHDGHVYAALTSVASNRGYQIIFRAAIEQAHKPEAWSVWQAGSLFHAEPIASESTGIWGQALSGFVDPAGTFRVMYPARNPASVGGIHIASRPWDEPFGRGVRLSAPNAPALGLLQRSYREFQLQLDVQARSQDPSVPATWSLLWNHRGPLGPDRAHAESCVSPLTIRDCTVLHVGADGIRIVQIDADGRTTNVAHERQAFPANQPCRLAVHQSARAVSAHLDGRELGTWPVDATGGVIALLAEKGAYLHVTRFGLDSTGEAPTTFWLPLEGLLGSGLPDASWRHASEHFRFHTGYVGQFAAARAKWSFHGQKVRLWSPRGPEYGRARVLLDDVPVAELDLWTAEATDSAVVWESPEVSAGPHALMLVRRSAGLPVDCVEVVSVAPG